uniref:Uncharacterized protein n=1 Tax=Oryza brachyantha TaxID=4533 RepID=J3MEC6_ORYBR
MKPTSQSKEERLGHSHTIISEILPWYSIAFFQFLSFVLHVHTFCKCAGTKPSILIQRHILVCFRKQNDLTLGEEVNHCNFVNWLADGCWCSK